MWPGALSTEILLFAMWRETQLCSKPTLAGHQLWPPQQHPPLSFIRRNYLKCLLFLVRSSDLVHPDLVASSFCHLQSELIKSWSVQAVSSQRLSNSTPHYRWGDPRSRSHSYRLSDSSVQTSHLVLYSQDVHRKLLDEHRTRPTLKMGQFLAVFSNEKSDWTKSWKQLQKSGHFQNLSWDPCSLEQIEGLPLSCFAKIWSPRFQAEQNLSHGPFSSSRADTIPFQSRRQQNPSALL